jgi:hypothetical protein
MNPNANNASVINTSVRAGKRGIGGALYQVALTTRARKRTTAFNPSRRSRG